jgi:hypothetical protein
MLSWIIKIIEWITQLWTGLPQPIKDKIIQIIVESFDMIFREFFKNNKKETEHE